MKGNFYLVSFYNTYIPEVLIVSAVYITGCNDTWQTALFQKLANYELWTDFSMPLKNKIKLFAIQPCLIIYRCPVTSFIKQQNCVAATGTTRMSKTMWHLLFYLHVLPLPQHIHFQILHLKPKIEVLLL